MKTNLAQTLVLGATLFFGCSLVALGAGPTEKDLLPLLRELASGSAGAFSFNLLGPGFPLNSTDRKTDVKILEIQAPQTADGFQRNPFTVPAGSKVWPVRTHVHLTYTKGSGLDPSDKLPLAADGDYTCYAFFKDGKWTVTVYQPTFKKSIF